MIKNFANSWFGRVIIGLIAISMVSFGGIGGGDPVLARVGSEKIKVRDVIERSRHHKGSLRGLLHLMVEELLFRSEAKRLGLVVTENEVASYIDNFVDSVLKAGDSDSGYSGPSNREGVLKWMRDRGITRTVIIDSIIRDQIIFAVMGDSDGPRPPHLMRLFVYRAVMQERFLRGRFVPWQMWTQPSMSEEEIREHYDQDPSRFVLPERRRFSWAVVDRDAFSKRMEIPDDANLESELEDQLSQNNLDDLAKKFDWRVHDSIVDRDGMDDEGLVWNSALYSELKNLVFSDRDGLQHGPNGMLLVISINERIPEKSGSFEDVEIAVRRDLSIIKKKEATRSHLSEIRSKDLDEWPVFNLAKMPTWYISNGSMQNVMQMKEGDVVIHETPTGFCKMYLSKVVTPDDSDMVTYGERSVHDDFLHKSLRGSMLRGYLLILYNLHPVVYNEGAVSQFCGGG